jgi:hypothetical protein
MRRFEDEMPTSKLLEFIRSTIREELKGVGEQGRAEWLTTEQTAILLQICPTSLEKARSLGRGPLAFIPHHKVGRSVRYARTDVVKAMTDLRVPGRAIKP